MTTINDLLSLSPLAEATSEQAFECLNTWLYKASKEVHTAMTDYQFDSVEQRDSILSTVRCYLVREELLTGDTRLLFRLDEADSYTPAALVRMDIDPDSQCIFFSDAVGLYGSVTDSLVEAIRKKMRPLNYDRSLWCARHDDDATKLLGPHKFEPNVTVPGML